MMRNISSRRLDRYLFCLDPSHVSAVINLEIEFGFHGLYISAILIILRERALNLKSDMMRHAVNIAVFASEE